VRSRLCNAYSQSTREIEMEKRNVFSNFAVVLQTSPTKLARQSNFVEGINRGLTGELD